MSDKRIVGIDIGSYAIKVAYLDPKSSDLSWEGFDRERVDVPAVANAPTSAGGPPPVPGSETFEDAPTGVHEAPTGDADATTERGESADEPADTSLDFSLTPDWVEAMRRLGGRDALGGAFQASAIPDGQAVLIELEVPFAEKAKVQNILPHLMVDRLPLPQTEITWDFQAFASEDEESEAPARALVGFAKNEDVGLVLEHLSAAGVDPALLGVPELQLAAIGSYATREEGVVAFVDIGHELTRVAVVKNQVPLQGRTIRAAGRQLTEAIQEKFENTFSEAESIKHQYGAILDDTADANAQMKGMSDAIQQGLRPIVRNLRRTFQGLYAKKRAEVQRVYICGGTSQIKNIEKYLSAELGLPVRRLVVPQTGLMDEEMSATGMLAMGAAISQQNDIAKSRNVNLRAGQFAFRGRSSYLRRQVAFAAAGMFVLLAILGLSLYLEKASYEAQRDAMKAAVEQQTKSLLGAEMTTKSAIQRVMESGDSASNSFIPQMSAYHLLHQLSVKMPKDVTVTLDRIEVDTDRNLIQVYGETTDAQAVDRIVSDLEAGIECLKEIKKDKLRVRDDKAEFELQISSGCS